MSIRFVGMSVINRSLKMVMSFLQSDSWSQYSLLQITVVSSIMLAPWWVLMILWLVPFKSLEPLRRKAKADLATTFWDQELHLTRYVNLVTPHRLALCYCSGFFFSWTSSVLTNDQDLIRLNPGQFIKTKFLKIVFKPPLSSPNKNWKK